MNHSPLAVINPQRRLSHVEGKKVTIHWDEHQFHITRAALSRFARVLEQGRVQLYAAKKGFSVVAVDGETREVWVGKTCLTLSQREYRSLLNAVLRTETRLHGLGAVVPVEQEKPEPNVHIHMPELLRLYWN